MISAFLVNIRGVEYIQAYSPDGSMLASASWDGNVGIWNVGEGRQIMRLEGHTDAVIGVQYAPDGKTLLSRSLDGTIRQWNVSDGRLIRTLFVPEQDSTKKK